MKKATKATSSFASQPVVKSTSPPAATPGEAKRLAATILEVLAGIHSPPDAARALGISLPRYYQLEARAIEGFVAALAPRPQGKQPSLENRVNTLEKQLDAARRQCARQEALVRVTQRSLGLVVAISPKSLTPERDPAGRKQRRPAVRALKAARTLQAQAAVAAPAAAGQGGSASVQPTAPQPGAEEVRPCSA